MTDLIERLEGARNDLNDLGAERTLDGHFEYWTVHADTIQQAISRIKELEGENERLRDEAYGYAIERDLGVD